MTRRDVYIIGAALVTKSAAANFVADHLVPKRERRAAYKRIHSRISAAQANGSLPAGDAFPAKLFFAWAAQQNDWSALHNIPDLSISASVVAAGAAAKGQVGSSTPVYSPSGYEELKSLYVEAVYKLEASQKESRTLKQELAAREQRKSALTEKLTESGKQGGRGNTK